MMISTNELSPDTQPDGLKVRNLKNPEVIDSATRLIASLKENPFALAPMAGITDHAFRSFMKDLGAGVVVTELVSSDGIKFGSERTLKLMSFDKSQRPIGIQLFGDDPTIMAEAAKKVEEMGADFVDINFGCPVPKVTKKGAGSAMLKDLARMEILLREVKRAINIPLTIKIRTGWDSGSKNASQVVDLAYNLGVAWVAIHGRTRAQAYEGLADWNYIAEVKAKAKLPIIGNGDIITAQQALKCLKESSVDGVMIGRGALKNPYIFQESLALWRGNEGSNLIQRNYAELFKNLAHRIEEHCDQRIVQIQLKKFAAWFATGYPGAAQLRKAVFQTKSTLEVKEIALQFFSRVYPSDQTLNPQDQFLMGGHG